MHYHISCANPLSHYVEITLTLRNWTREVCHLQLPAWRPGRYEIANYAKFVRRVRATGTRNRSLEIVKTHKDGWKVRTEGCSKITIYYEFYAFQMDAGGSLVDDRQWYFNFINCLLYTKERLNSACTISLDLPKGYQVATGLRPRKAGGWRAASYYQLVDCPLMASRKMQQWSYQVGGVNFHLWFMGSHKLSKSKVLKAFRAFSELQIKLFGEFPEKDYHFLYQFLEKRFYHGVEHANSTVIAMGPAAELHEQRYQDFLGVSSHELFHAWNILKIRPKKLLPYDFSQETYFQEGFVAEGFTTYYGDLCLLRSGVFDQHQYFKEINTLFKRHFENQGRLNASLMASSQDLWLDGYQMAAPARKVSIYTKGALVALILDLIIRQLTVHQQSLDQVMRQLWEDYGKKSRGYQTKDVEQICSRLTGTSFKEQFDSLVRGTDLLEPILDSALATVGCGIRKVASKLPLKRHYGIKTSNTFGELTIIQLAPGSPAKKKLSPGDIIVEINHKKATKVSKKALDKSTALKLVINRGGRTLNINLRKSKAQFYPQLKLTKLSKTTKDQRLSYKKWTGHDF